MRCQQPTCWRRESPGPSTPALAPVSSGPAEASLRGYMTPSVPPPPPRLLLLLLPPGPHPTDPSPRLRWGEALLLFLAAPLLHFSSFFVCLCLGSSLRGSRVRCRACAVLRACACFHRPPSLCTWRRGRLTIVRPGFDIGRRVSLWRRQDRARGLRPSFSHTH